MRASRPTAVVCTSSAAAPAPTSTPSSWPTCCNVRSSCRHPPSTSRAAPACRRRQPSAGAGGGRRARVGTFRRTAARSRPHGRRDRGTRGGVPRPLRTHAPRTRRSNVNRTSFNDGWRVRPKGDAFMEFFGGEGPAWEDVQLPHDAMLGGERDADGHWGTGFFPGGMWEYGSRSLRPSRCGTSGSCSNSRASTAAPRCGSTAYSSATGRTATPTSRCRSVST